jgi:hypothetical protein
MVKKMGELKMKILISPMSRWWYKHKMLMLHNLLLKWSIEEIHLLQNHPQDLIIGSPSKGVMTRSQKLASFVAHHSFVSCYEPTKIEEALKDPDWINAMHEELNNFTRNEVWTLEDRPKGARVIGTK